MDIYAQARVANELTLADLETSSPPKHVRKISNTTLFKGVAKGDTSLFKDKALIDAELRDWQHRTLLIKAAELGQDSVLQALIDLKLDTDARDVFGYTALALACQKSKASCVELLLKAGCAVCTQTEQQETPLHLAVAQAEQNPEAAAVIVRALLQAGADPLAQDKNGFTAAKLSTDADVRQLLLSAEAAAIAAQNPPAKASAVVAAAAAADTPAAATGKELSECEKGDCGVRERTRTSIVSVDTDDDHWSDEDRDALQKLVWFRRSGLSKKQIWGLLLVCMAVPFSSDIYAWTASTTTALFAVDDPTGVV